MAAHSGLNKVFMEEKKLQDSKNKEAEGIRSRTTARINAINKELHPFNTTNSEKENMIKIMTDELYQWPGGVYNPEKVKTFSSCFKIVRSHWNRKKSKVLGDILFYPIFCEYFQDKLASSNASSTEILLVFITKIINLMDKRVKFNKTKANPLIPNSCFLQSKELKEFCKTFVQIFSNNKIHWNEPKITNYPRNKNGKVESKYIGDRNRSQKLMNSFKNSLQTIKNNLKQNVNDNTIQQQIQNFCRIHSIKCSIVQHDNNHVQLPTNPTNNDCIQLNDVQYDAQLSPLPPILPISYHDQMLFDANLINQSPNCIRDNSSIYSRMYCDSPPYPHLYNGFGYNYNDNYSVPSINSYGYEPIRGSSYHSEFYRNNPMRALNINNMTLQ